MKCSICGTESKGDARFCSGCGATLILPKTDETMLDLRTALFRRPVIVPAAPPGGAAPAPGGPPQATRVPAASSPIAGRPPAASPSNRGGLVLVLIAIGIVAYFLYQVATTYGGSWFAPSSGTSVEPQRPAPPVATATELPKRDATATPVPRVAPVEPARPTQPAIAAAPDVVVPMPQSVVPASKPSVAAPRPAELNAPVKAAATRPSRWQDMKEALARCAHDNLVSRVVCEQRVVTLYCSEYWGKVPQCPDAQNPFK
jgi:hypothetical protein